MFSRSNSRLVGDQKDLLLELLLWQTLRFRDRFEERLTTPEDNNRGDEHNILENCRQLSINPIIESQLNFDNPSNPRVVERRYCNCPHPRYHPSTESLNNDPSSLLEEQEEELSQYDFHQANGYASYQEYLTEFLYGPALTEDCMDDLYSWFEYLGLTRFPWTVMCGLWCLFVSVAPVVLYIAHNFFLTTKNIDC